MPLRDAALIDAAAKTMETTWTSIGPICLTNIDGRFAVARRSAMDRGSIAVHERTHLIDPTESIWHGAMITELGRWREIAQAGWRLD